MEVLGKGLLDSSCTKTVSGELWMDEYINTLSEEDRKSVKEGEGNAIFVFGDGIQLKSIRSVRVPAYILRNFRYFFTIHVVAAEIPLLISNREMKKMGMKIDFSRDVATIRQQDIKLISTQQGHYCLPLNYYLISSMQCNITLTVSNIKSLDRTTKLLKARKLHRQFGHAALQPLLKMVKNSKHEDKEFIECIK